jgi:hypothetical protein
MAGNVIGLRLAPTSVHQYVVARIGDYGWKSSNGPLRDLRNGAYFVKFNVGFLPDGTYFAFVSSPSCSLKSGAYCFCRLSIFWSLEGPFSQRENAISKIIKNRNASLNDRRRADTTISDPAETTAAT